MAIYLQFSECLMQRLSAAYQALHLQIIVGKKSRTVILSTLFESQVQPTAIYMHFDYEGLIGM